MDLFNKFYKNTFTSQKDVQTRAQFLPKPSSQMEEVLYLLITKKKMSRAGFFENGYILNSPEVISNLRKLGLGIETENLKTVNKFGRDITYGVYSIEGNEAEAIELYMNLKSKKNV